MRDEEDTSNSYLWRLASIKNVWLLHVTHFMKEKYSFNISVRIRHDFYEEIGKISCSTLC